MAETTMTSERIEEVLSTVPIFSRLGSRDIKKLAKLCVPRTFEPDETIIEEGATGLGMFVITSGRVEVYKANNGGRLELGAMEEGDVLGEVALIDDQPRSASAVARTRTECLLLTRDSFETLVKKDPEIAWCIVPGLAERIRELHQRALAAEDSLEAARQEGAAAEGSRSRPSDARGDRAEDSKRAGADKAADSEEEEEEKDSEAWETMGKMMRLQYGAMMGGVTGMAGMARVFETFFKKLADETDIKDSDSLSDIMDKAPDGFVEASRKALCELEDVPQEMADSFRSVCKDD